MRITGGYQSLSIETDAVLQQAVSLARRRAHAQVTPLHVAIAMLSEGLLKRACIQSHSHPLQLRALELCFNISLNRLPSSESLSPLRRPHSHLLFLSNSLFAALKRANAHQSRGSVENQQQPVQANKVEVQQLIVSILDDPSVSRVMREAGFSSTEVKNNLDKCNSIISHQTIQTSRFSPLGEKASQSARNDGDDVGLSVLEAMMYKETKNTIVVGEGGESLVRGVLHKLEKNDVPGDMKFVQFVTMSLNMNITTKDELEVKLGEVRSYVKNRGVVLYLGDVNWVFDFWGKHYGDEQRSYYHYYDRVDCMVIRELNRLVEENYKRLWLIGIASFRTYANCKLGSPSLETLWSLHPLLIPVANLALSLSIENSTVDMQDIKVVKAEAVDDSKSSLFGRKGEVQKQVGSCCLENIKKQSHQDLVMSITSTSKLPSWIQQCKDEDTKQIHVDHKEYFDDRTKHQHRKWNSICSSSHTKKHGFLGNILALNMSVSSSPCSSASVSSNGLHNNVAAGAENPDLVSNPNSSQNSAYSSEENYKMEGLDLDKLKALREELEKKVPSQRRIVPEIVSTILKCRSKNARQESWMFFLGAECRDKVTMARELAKAVFGSYNHFTSIGMSCFSTTIDHHESSTSRKRARDEHGDSLYDRFAEAVSHYPRRVFYVEDADRLDYRSLKGFKKAINYGSVWVCDGGLALMRDAIVIFSCEEGNSEDELREEEQCVPLDLNVATEDDDGDDEKSVSGILNLVHHKVVFKKQV